MEKLRSKKMTVSQGTMAMERKKWIMIREISDEHVAQLYGAYNCDLQNNKHANACIISCSNQRITLLVR